MDELEESKKSKIAGIVVAVVAIIIITALALVYYFLAADVFSEEIVFQKINATLSIIVGREVVVFPEAPAVMQPETLVFTTEVVIFKTPESLPTEIKQGKCFSGSIAQPYRQDALRCQVESQIFDPCFITPNDYVYCKTDPSKEGGDFLIKITDSLPKIVLPKELKNNWAWFVELKDGTFCSPFTGTKPMIQGGAIANYGCKSNAQGQNIVLIGDLKRGSIWTATKAILSKSGANLVITSSQKQEIKSVWQ